MAVPAGSHRGQAGGGVCIVGRWRIGQALARLGVACWLLAGPGIGEGYVLCVSAGSHAVLEIAGADGTCVHPPPGLSPTYTCSPGVAGPDACFAGCGPCRDIPAAPAGVTGGRCSVSLDTHMDREARQAGAIAPLLRSFGRASASQATAILTDPRRSAPDSIRASIASTVLLI